MKIKYDAISHVGSVRGNNEDMALVFGAFLRDDSQRSMVPMKQRPRFSALVADGMGGYGGGEIASEMTLRSFDTFLTSLPGGLDADGVKSAVKEWFRTNNSNVLVRAASDPELARMGTTLTGIFTYGPYEFMLNAGDSRVYRRRYDTLRQITVDHSERERLNDPSVASNLIYNAIGIPSAFVDVTCMGEELPIIDGDTYLICSDGLSDMISDDQIDSILAAGGNARTLVDAAIAAGGRDNCTVVLLQVSMPEDDAVPAPEKRPEPEVKPDVADMDAVSAINPALLLHDSNSGLPAGEAASSPASVPAAPSIRQNRPTEVPPEALYGFSIDKDDEDDDCLSESEPLPPPLPSEIIIERRVEKEPPAQAVDDSVQSRAKTAGNLIKEAFNVFFKKK